MSLLIDVNISEDTKYFNELLIPA